MVAILSLLLLFSQDESWAAPPKKKHTSVKSSPGITCSFTNTDGYADYGKIEVYFGKDGKIELIEGHRAKIGADSVFKFRFERKDSTFAHISENNCLEKDEDTGEPICEWGIEAVEAITAENKNKDKIYLRVNDHLYAGNPGSSIVYHRAGKELEDPGDTMGNCKGKLMHPSERPTLLGITNEEPAKPSESREYRDEGRSSEEAPNGSSISAQ